MKRYIPLLLFLSVKGWSAVPTKHEWTVFPNDANMAAPQYQMKLPNPTASGDAVWIGITYASARSISTIKDNKGSKWNIAVSSTDATNSQAMSIIYTTGTVVGVSSVTVVFDAGTNFAQAAGIVFNNIATGSAVSSIIDTTTGGRRTGTAIGCGRMDLTATGDELLQFTTTDGSLPNAMVNMTTATASQAMFGVDSDGIWGGTYGNISGSGVTDSTITMSSSLNSTVNACVAIKTASGGGSPGTGIYVQQVASLNFNDPQNLGVQTSFKVDFPCQSDSGINLIDALVHTSGGPTITSVTSSPANVWVSTINTAGSNLLGHIYATNAVVNSTMTITFNLSSTPHATDSAFTAHIMGISGAATSPLDVICSNSFNSAQSSGTLQNQPSCQTTGSNELLTVNQQEDRQTVTDASPGYPMMADSGGPYGSFKFMQDGGYQHYYVATSSNVNVRWVYSFYEGGAAIGSNTGMAIAWNPVPPITVIETPRILTINGGKFSIQGGKVVVQ